MFIILFISVVFIALVLAITSRYPSLRDRPLSDGQSHSFILGRPLLSEAERNFFHVLKLAAGDSLIFVKVRLADMVTPKKTHSRSAWKSSFGKISQKHVDFVLCSKTDIAILAVVELDDRSHLSFDRGLRDAFVDEALTSAGIPVIRIRAKQSYSLAEIRKALDEKLGASMKRTQPANYVAA
jgi:hypothetical protein